MINEGIRLTIANTPNKPGVYIWKDEKQKILYVGKADKLKNRLKNYLNPTDEKTANLVEASNHVESIVCSTPVEALILEDALVKQNQPRYNVRLRDDKRYPYIKISTYEKYPRIEVVRRVATDGGRYFGPYVDGGDVRKVLKIIGEFFGVCKCKKDHKTMERPCINHSLGICAGPHLILDEKEYRKKVDEACHFLSGNHVMVEKILRDEIKRKSNETKFEEALILRDKISALNSMRENQNIAGSKLRDMDILGYGCFKGKANICQMQVRNHNVIQFLNHPLLGVFKFEEGDSIKAFIKQHYSTADLIPKSIYTSGQPTNINDLIQALTDLKKTKVEIKMAQRGQIYRLVQMAVKNSLHQMMMDGLGAKEKNQTDLLKNYLKLKRIPQRIEGYDISNLGEKNTVGSMVVYQNGAMNKNEYRRFKIKGTGQNDAKNMSEMISRRLKHSEWKTPDIILLDGGKPQLNAVKYLIPKGIELISLAKKEEEIYQFGRAKPLKLKKDDRALLLLESIRDEAHRFGKKYHKLLRKKSFINQKRRPQPQIPSKESVSPTT